MQRLLKISSIRNRLYGRAAEKFVAEQEAKGIILRNEDVIERLSGLRTVLVDAPLIMEGFDAVRRITAPLETTDPSRLKHQASWMVLTAAISLGCDACAPLEELVREMNFEPERLIRQYPRVKTLPYDGERGVETTIHKDMGGLRSYAKGDTKSILDKCIKVLDGRERVMTDKDRERALEAAQEMEEEGLRTLAFATRWLKEPGEYEEEMVFLGIVGMGDLPHLDAPWAMEALRGAGIRPVLVSAREMMPGAVAASGALHGEAGVMLGTEIEALADDDLSEAAVHADAFLEVSWQQREKLAKAMRRDGVVATLSLEPESGGMVLALTGGAEPDVVFEEGGVRTMVRLLGECRALCEAYSGEKQG